jgi:hypothetical protein
VRELGGQQGHPRDWIFVELGTHWYVRDQQWKLNEAGELFDMHSAPFEETKIATNGENSETKAERKKLEAVLDQLSPATGKMDPSNPTGKHAKKRKKAALQ